MIKTGSKDLDEFIGNYDKITCFYGPAGTGKTCCCLIAAIEQAKNNKRVIFIDTENGFNLERVEQLAKDDYKKVLDNIILFRINGFKDQQLKIKALLNLIEKINVSLIIVDTMGYYYRRLRKSKLELANKMLISQMRILKEISEKVPVIVTNQVYQDIKNNKVGIVGGEILKSDSHRLIELEKEPKRKIKLLKPERKEMFFKIIDKGIVKIQNINKRD